MTLGQAPALRPAGGGFPIGLSPGQTGTYITAFQKWPAQGPQGYALRPAIRPIGNAPAYNFLAATRWPKPQFCDDFITACNGTRVRMPTSPAQRCAPKRPDFYRDYPGSHPEGPIDDTVDPWPSDAKPWPGGPLTHDGQGGFLVSAPQLPANGRAPARMDSAQVYEAEMGQGPGGTGWWWLLALGVGGMVWASTRRGR